MTSSQLDNPHARRAISTAGRWVDPAEAGLHRWPSTAGAGADLGRASALLDAATRMHDSSDPQTLLHVIATEALQLLTADGVVVLNHDRHGTTPELHLPSAGAAPDLALATARCARLDAAHLLEPGQVPDLNRPWGLQAESGIASGLPPWRSILVADLHSPRSSQPARLLWYATSTDAFADSADLAGLFARHAGLALRSVSQRHHLQRAVEGRTITGQATGILMHRYHLTAAAAFDTLKQYSQDHNIKVRDVAEAIVLTGELAT
jgi:hypothetical protein